MFIINETNMCTTTTVGILQIIIRVNINPVKQHRTTWYNQFGQA